MHVKTRNISLALLLVLVSPLSTAGSLMVAEDESGSLYLLKPGNKQVLWSNFRLDEVMAQTYLLNRSGSQYLVWQSFSNDRAVIAVPVVNDNGKPSFNRVLYFSRDFTLSNQSNRDVREGLELRLPKPLPLKGLTWEKVHIIAAELSHRSYGHESPVPGPQEGTPGFHKTALLVFAGNGKFIKTKQYIDRADETWTIESSACISNCDRPDVLADGDYVGAVGNLPITLSIHLTDGKIEGTYRYSKTSRDARLFLQGSVLDDGSLHIIEYPQKNQPRSTGSFDASLVDGIWCGTWKSADEKRTLSFFAVPATL